MRKICPEEEVQEHEDAEKKGGKETALQKRIEEGVPEEVHNSLLQPCQMLFRGRDMQWTYLEWVERCIETIPDGIVKYPFSNPKRTLRHFKERWACCVVSQKFAVHSQAAKVV